MAVIAGAVYAWVTFGPIPASTKEHYGEECADWLSEKYGNGKPATVIDVWRKRGKIVFEISIPDEDQSTSVLLCVVTTSTGRMLKPSIYDFTWR